jgi:AcrR family transcriptional regulator
MSDEKPTKRRNRHAQRKAATRQRLLDAARDVIGQKGYNNVEILDITEHADVSKATFYQHFANKEDCVRELMHQGFDVLAEQILGADDRPRPVDPAWVVNALTQVFRWAEDNREFLLIMVGGAASSRLNMFGRNYMVELTERTLIADFAPYKTFRYPADIQAQIFTGVLIQLLGWWLENDTGHSARQMAQLIHDVLQYGMGPLEPDTEKE